MELNLNQELGPQIVIRSEKFVLKAGVKSSSLFGSGGNGNSPTQNITITAMEALGAYRAVGTNGLYSQNNEASLSKYAGVTKVAVTSGSATDVVRVGLMSDPAWTWTPEQPVFITGMGVLTQTAPTGAIRRIGWAVSPTQINLEPFPIIGA